MSSSHRGRGAPPPRGLALFSRLRDGKRRPRSWLPFRPPCPPFVLRQQAREARGPRADRCCVPDSSPSGFSARRCRNMPEGARRFSGAKRCSSVILFSRQAGRRRACSGWWPCQKGDGWVSRRSVLCCPPGVHPEWSTAPSWCREGQVLRNHGRSRARPPDEVERGRPLGADAVQQTRPCPSASVSLCDAARACVSAGTPWAQGSAPHAEGTGRRKRRFPADVTTGRLGKGRGSGFVSLPRPRRRMSVTRGPPVGSPQLSAAAPQHPRPHALLSAVTRTRLRSGDAQRKIPEVNNLGVLNLALAE